MAYVVAVFDYVFCKCHLTVTVSGMDAGCEPLELVNLGPARGNALEYVGEPGRRELWAMLAARKPAAA